MARNASRQNCVADLHLDRARRSYRSSASSSRALSATIAAIFSINQRLRLRQFTYLSDTSSAVRMHSKRQFPGPAFLPQNPDGLVIGIGKCARDQVPAMDPHAIEIDLSFGDPPRSLQRLGVGARAGDFLRNAFLGKALLPAPHHRPADADPLAISSTGRRWADSRMIYAH